MGLAALMTAVVVLFILSGCLLYWFGNWFKHRLIVTVSVLISWYFSFMIVVVLPTDVSSTIYRQCLHDANGSLPWPGPVPLVQSNATPAVSPTPLPSNGTALAPLNVSTSGTIDNSSIFDANVSFVGASSPMPLDRYSCAEPWSFVPDNVLQSLWRVVYWTSQMLTWIIFPLMQSFSKAGDFTFWGKMKSALRDNGIYYASYLMLAGSFLIYLASIGTSLDWPKLKAIAATASNTWGLTLLILLLGYGLVEVPRTLWHMSRSGYVLEHDYFEAAKLVVEKTDAEEEVEDVVRILKAWSAQIPPGHPLHNHLVTIRAKLPEAYDTAFSSAPQARISPGSGFDQPTEKSMILLHKQLIKALQAQHRTKTQWRVLVDSINFDEDVAKNEASMDRYFKRSQSTAPSSSTCWRRIYSPTVEWYWHCLFKRHLLRVLSVVCAIWTVFVIWSEVTFFASNPTLSLFAVFLDLARSGRDYFSVELVSFFTIVYLCICTYFTIFKIRILNLYYLAPHHGTDEYSLLFSGMLLCRLTPPLCLNFLSLVHLDSHITKTENMLETSYTHIMGHMDVIDFISDYFNIYFPIGVVLLCAATWFSLGSRVLSLLGFQQFMADTDVTSELVQEGQELVRREKRKRRQPPVDGGAGIGNVGVAARARGAAALARSQPPSTGRLERQSSSSRLQLIPNSESMDYTSFGDPGPSLSFNNGGESRRFQPSLSTPPVTTGSGSLRRDIFDDV